MPSRQDLLIYAAVVLGDGAWLFAALTVAGFISGQGGAPFAWPVVFALLIAAIVATRVVAAIPMPHPDPAVVQTGLGVIASYAAVASSATAGGGFALLWAGRFVTGGYDMRTGVGIAVGFVGAALVWRHGMLLAAPDLPVSRLQRSFRYGILALGPALLLEQAVGRDLGATAMLLPFFAGSLAALAMARMRRNSAIGGDWIRVIGTTVVAVVGLGLGVALLGGAVVRETAAVAGRAWGPVADGLLWALHRVVEPIAWLVAQAVEWLLVHIPRAFGRPPVRTQTIDWWQVLKPDAATPEEAIGSFLQYPVLLLFLALVCWVLFKAYRLNASYGRPMATEYRERIDGDAAGDLARLIAGVLPPWLRGSAGRPRRWQLHEDDPGLADAFRLYYDALGLAADRGAGFDPCLTPTERIPQLARALPGVPVDRITACFAAACYGHKRIDPAEAAALRAALETAHASASANDEAPASGTARL